MAELAIDFTTKMGFAAKMAYVSFTDAPLVDRTETVSVSPLVNIDYDKSGALVGIEIEMPS